MRRLMVALLILAFAVPAFAGMNPGIRAFISFRPNCPTEAYPTDPYVHTVAWAGEKTYNSFFMLDCFGNTLPPPDPALLGCRGVMFYWQTIPSDPSYPPDQMAALYYPTGTQVIGGPDQSIGWILAWPDCWLATVCTNGTKIMKVFRQGYYCYNPLKINILPNETDGKLVVDCLYGEDQFCVLANGGIGIAPDPGDIPCLCETPNAVEDASWGGIKALYR